MQIPNQSENYLSNRVQKIILFSESGTLPSKGGHNVRT